MLASLLSGEVNTPALQGGVFMASKRVIVIFDLVVVETRMSKPLSACECENCQAVTNDVVGGGQGR